MMVNGLKVDSRKIAEGMYNLICEADEHALVAFGMLPKWIMDILEKETRAKVIQLSAAQLQCTVEELTPFIDQTLLRNTVQPIVSQVATEIYAVASERGMMIV